MGQQKAQMPNKADLGPDGRSGAEGTSPNDGRETNEDFGIQSAGGHKESWRPEDNKVDSDARLDGPTLQEPGNTGQQGTNRV
jgi:hypothetical protein